ncbi:MAG: AAA family ATPase, partial [Prochlorothrix sp.]
MARITKISIEGLFGVFDYEIPLNQDDRITILTGPNGFGKTTILKLIYTLITDLQVLLDEVLDDSEGL